MQIELTFIKNHAMRKVFIKDKQVIIITPELNNQPLIFDEDKYNKLIQSEQIKKLSNMNESELKETQDKKTYELINEIKSNNIDFNNYEQLKKDLINDFQLSGWRCINR